MNQKDRDRQELVDNFTEATGRILESGMNSMSQQKRQIVNRALQNGGKLVLVVDAADMVLNAWLMRPDWMGEVADEHRISELFQVHVGGADPGGYLKH